MSNLESELVETNLPGVKAFKQPPEDFVISEASDEDLIRFGFPVYPGSKSHRELLNSFRPQKVKRIIPNFEITNVSRPKRPKPEVDNIEKSHGIITQNNSIWSGAVIVDHVNNPFANWGSAVLGRWSVPAVNCGGSSPGGNYSCCWVGVDGFGGDELLQVGTETDVSCPGGNVSNYAWFQWLPMYPNQVRANLGINTGDVVQAWVGPWQGDISKGYVSLINVTQGGTELSLQITPAGLTTIQGYSAEWIVERPTINGAPSNLANYNQMSMITCYAITYAGKTEAGPAYAPNVAPTGDAYVLTMTDNANNPVSEPSVINGPPFSPTANIPNVSINFSFV